MIDLTNKYVPNVAGKLRDAFIAECHKQGYVQYSDETLIHGGFLLCRATIKGQRYLSFKGDSGLELFTIGQEEPIWNNKAPKNMTKEEFLALASDLYDGKEIEFLYDNYWSVNDGCTFGTKEDYLYRIKPETKTPAQLKLEELEETIKKATEQINELKKGQ